MIRTRFLIAVLFCTVLSLSFSAYATPEPITGNTTADVTFEAGELSLVKMQDFTFGLNTITNEVNQYPAEETTIYLEVHDLRGSGEGWNLRAHAETFQDEAMANSLPGAIINLTGGVAQTPPAGRTAPTVESTIALDTDGTSAQVANAVRNAGMGAWTISWEVASGKNTKVTLYVPSGAATTGKHTSKITWTLVNAPK